MQSRRWGWTQLEGIIQTWGCICVVAILSAILVPNFIRARHSGQWNSCKSNLKNTGTALEMYAADNKGQYPTRLQQVVPAYLREIPTCPAAGSQTYSSTYQVSQRPDDFTCTCSGRHHSSQGDPSFNGQSGLNPGPRPDRGSSTSILDWLLSGVLGLMGGYFFVLHAFLLRPEPLPETEAVVKASRTLAWLNSLSWPLLCLLLSLLLGYNLHFESRLARFSVSSFVGPLLAQVLVIVGGRLWRLLSPAAQSAESGTPPVSQIPKLSSPNLTPVILTPQQLRLARWITGSTPLLTLATLAAVPSLGQDAVTALRGSLYGLAAGALLIFPAYLWGRRWSSDLFQRQLEWIPGTGELLLHSRRWGQPATVRLGTQADVHSIEPVSPHLYQIKIGNVPFLVASGPFLENLQECLPAHES